MALNIHYYNNMIDDNENPKRKDCNNFVNVLGNTLAKISLVNCRYAIHYGIIKEDDNNDI
mgnify:CR=1 FL=1